MGRPRFVCLLLALVTILVYWPVQHHGFIVFDDGDYVSENRTVQSGLTAAGIQWAFTTFHSSNWHPLTWLSLMLDCQLFGPDAGALHLVNVLFHTANAVLLLLLLQRMTGALWPSAVVAALFAWHPLHVESVAWISERKDILSTFFALLSLLAYVRYAKDKHRRSLWVALILFALGLMAKPMLVTLPFVMLLLDYWPLGRFTVEDLRLRIGGLIIEKLPFFALTAASCAVTYLAQRSEAVVALERHPLDLRAANAIVSCARYLQKMIWPADLAILYPLPHAIPWAHVATSAIILAVISWFAWNQRLQKPFLIVGWLWFLGTLVPVIGLVQVGGQSMADRYTYWPLIGVFIAFAFTAQQFAKERPQKQKAMTAVAILMLAGCLAATANQLRYWQDSTMLFAHAVAVTGSNTIACINLGVALEQQGRKEDALSQYLEAARIDPGRVQIHNNLANLLDELGRTDDAAAHYQEALRLKPTAPLAHLNYGAFLVRLGRFGEAEQHYAEAARLIPDDPRPFYLIGRAKVLQLNPEAAVGYFRDALKLDPNDVQTLTALARVFAANETPQAIRNGTEAVALAETADKLTGGQQPYVLETLAMAYAASSRFAEAERSIQQAIDISEAAGATNDIAELQRQLSVYQNQRH